MVFSDTAPEVIPKLDDYRLPPEPPVLCVIPARGGSKGFPGKNVAELRGHPLIAHTIMQAMKSRYITRLFVSTDDKDIACVSEEYGAEVMMRPDELAGDLAPSEWAVRHVMNELSRTEDFEPTYIMMLQCTSPIRRTADIDNAFNELLNTGADSLLSVVEAPRFIWQGVSGDAYPVNYDYRSRPMRQYGALGYMENGSIYITKKHIMERMGNRLGGKIALYEMGYWSQFEIDQPDDMDLCEWIMEREDL